MEDVFSRIVEHLSDRITGPMALRLILQPTMATLMAIKDGLRDARGGKPPYFWAMFSDPAHRRELLTSGWNSVAKVFVLAFILDGVYQWIALRWFYPGEALLVAIILAIVPYLIVRGLVNRLARGAGAVRGASRPAKP
jgi:hypothetical protein